MSGSKGVAITGFRVFTALSSDDPSASHLKLVVDMPGHPEGFVLILDRETAVMMAEDLQAGAALIERGEHGRDDA